MFSKAYEEMAGKEVLWTGHYEQFNQFQPMQFQDMQVGLNGQIVGSGSDVVGQFQIQGQVSRQGTVQFVKQYIGQHAVQYNGIVGDSHVKGRWTIPGTSTQPGGFELKMDLEEWKGNYEFNGQKYNMEFDIHMDDRGIFGIDKDSQGVFIIRGFYNGQTYEVQFTKQYVGGEPFYFRGNMENDGKHWIVRGNYQFSKGTGPFEIYREAPPDQQYTAYVPPPVAQAPPPVMYQQGYIPGNQMMFAQQQPQVVYMQQQQPQVVYMQGQEQPNQVPEESFEGPLEDYHIFSGEHQDVLNVLNLLARGKKMTGEQFVEYIPRITYEEDLRLFASKVGPFLIELEPEHIIQAVIVCEHPAVDIVIVEELHNFVKLNAIEKNTILRNIHDRDQHERLSKLLGTGR